MHNYVNDTTPTVQTGKSKKTKRRRQVRNGRRVAVVQALSAAVLVLENGFTQAQAAEGCAVNHVYHLAEADERIAAFREIGTEGILNDLVLASD